MMTRISESGEIFSPKNFEEYIGQDRAKKIAKVVVGAAKIENRRLPNILIDGSYGLGKTSLAHVILREYGEASPTLIDASSLNKDLLPFSMNKKSVIVDEIHNLEPQVADSLNILSDQGKLSIIGCTTNAGALPSAFRSRFRAIHLERYTVAQIKQILDLAALRRSLIIPTKPLNEIARRARLNPRVGLNYLAFVLDLMAVKGAVSVDSRTVTEAFDTLGVDAQGFLDRDYRYMKALSLDKPVGIHYLSTYLGTDSKTIEEEIEPYLLQNGYIDRTHRGRIKLKDI